MQLNDVFIHDFDDVLKVIIWCLCAQQLRNHSVTVNCCERIIKIIKMKTCNCLRPIGSLTNCTSSQTWMTLGWWRNLNGTNQKKWIRIKCSVDLAAGLFLHHLMWSMQNDRLHAFYYKVRTIIVVHWEIKRPAKQSSNEHQLEKTSPW